MVQIRLKSKMSIIDSYKKLLGKRGVKTSTPITAYIPSPKEIDYKRGYIRRFFAQRSNDKTSPIIEISSDEFNRIGRTNLYRAISLRWRIKGPKEMIFNKNGKISDKGVITSNRTAIKLVSDSIPNLILYLPNLLQFYKK